MQTKRSIKRYNSLMINTVGLNSAKVNFGDTQTLLARHHRSYLQIVGSSFDWTIVHCGLGHGQATYTCSVPLSPSSIIWYWPSGDLFGWDSNRGPSGLESNGSLPPGLRLMPRAG